MSQLDANETKMMKLALNWCIEYLYVSVYNISSKAGMAGRKLENEEFEMDDFDTLWKEFLILLSPVKIDKEYQATLDLILFSYNEFGLSVEFKKMITTALLQNEKFKSTVNGMPYGLGEMLYKDEVSPDTK